MTCSVYFEGKEYLLKNKEFLIIDDSIDNIKETMLNEYITPQSYLLLNKSIIYVGYDRLLYINTIIDKKTYESMNGNSCNFRKLGEIKDHPLTVATGLPVHKFCYFMFVSIKKGKVTNPNVLEVFKQFDSQTYLILKLNMGVELQNNKEIKTTVQNETTVPIKPSNEVEMSNKLSLEESGNIPNQQKIPLHIEEEEDIDEISEDEEIIEDIIEE